MQIIYIYIEEIQVENIYIRFKRSENNNNNQNNKKVKKNENEIFLRKQTINNNHDKIT